MKNMTITKMPLRTVSTNQRPSWSKTVPMLRLVSTVLNMADPRNATIHGV